MEQDSGKKAPQDSSSEESTAFGRWLSHAREQVRTADAVLKKKAAVIGVWLLLSAAAVIIAFFPYLTDGRRPLDAKVRIQKVASLSQPIVALYLENTGTDAWEKAELTVNSRYALLLPTVLPGTNTVAQLDKFKDPDGDAAPTSMPLKTLRLSCEGGTLTFDLETGEITSR